jgi:3-dehydroquinate synthetase
MLFALRLALRRGLPQDAAQRLKDLLRRCDLPPLPSLEIDSILTFMGRDKKMTEQGLTWVLPTAVGVGGMVDGITTQEVEAILPAFLADPWSSAA